MGQSLPLPPSWGRDPPTASAAARGAQRWARGSPGPPSRPPGSALVWRSSAPLRAAPRGPRAPPGAAASAPAVGRRSRPTRGRRGVTGAAPAPRGARQWQCARPQPGRPAPSLSSAGVRPRGACRARRRAVATVMTASCHCSSSSPRFLSATQWQLGTRICVKAAEFTSCLSLAGCGECCSSGALRGYSSLSKAGKKNTLCAVTLADLPSSLIPAACSPSAELSVSRCLSFAPCPPKRHIATARYCLLYTLHSPSSPPPKIRNHLTSVVYEPSHSCLSQPFNLVFKMAAGFPASSCLRKQSS